MKLLVVTLLLLFQAEVLAQQPRAPLTSEIVRHGLNAKLELVEVKLTVASTVELGKDVATYKYEFANHSTEEVRLLPTLTHNNETRLVGEFITDVDKPADYRVGRGPSMIVLKAGETRIFAVKDDSKEFLSTPIKIFIIDKSDVAYAAGGATIFFPAWEHIFGQQAN